MGSPFNGDTFIEQEFLYLKERFELTTAVETGTHEADTTVWLAKNFLKTVSCELNHDLVEKAKEKFKRENGLDYAPEEIVVARIGEAALKAWDENGTVPPGWEVDPAAIRAGWTALLADIAALPEAADVLVVTSNGTARFLPDVVDAAPDGLDRKLKTGAWGEIVVAPGRSEITAWNVRP